MRNKKKKHKMGRKSDTLQATDSVGAEDTPVTSGYRVLAEACCWLGDKTANDLSVGKYFKGHDKDQKENLLSQIKPMVLPQHVCWKS